MEFHFHIECNQCILNCPTQLANLFNGNQKSPRQLSHFHNNQWINMLFLQTIKIVIMRWCEQPGLSWSYNTWYFVLRSFRRYFYRYYLRNQWRFLLLQRYLLQLHWCKTITSMLNGHWKVCSAKSYQEFILLNIKKTTNQKSNVYRRQIYIVSRQLIVPQISTKTPTF